MCWGQLDALEVSPKLLLAAKIHTVSNTAARHSEAEEILAYAISRYAANHVSGVNADDIFRTLTTKYLNHGKQFMVKGPHPILNPFIEADGNKRPVEDTIYIDFARETDNGSYINYSVAIVPWGGKTVMTGRKMDTDQKITVYIPPVFLGNASDILDTTNAMLSGLGLRMTTDLRQGKTQAGAPLDKYYAEFDTIDPTAHINLHLFHRHGQQMTFPDGNVARIEWDANFCNKHNMCNKCLRSFNTDATRRCVCLNITGKRKAPGNNNREAALRRLQAGTSHI